MCAHTDGGKSSRIFSASIARDDRCVRAARHRTASGSSRPSALSVVRPAVYVLLSDSIKVHQQKLRKRWRVITLNRLRITHRKLRKRWRAIILDQLPMSKASEAVVCGVVFRPFGRSRDSSLTTFVTSCRKAVPGEGSEPTREQALSSLHLASLGEDHRVPRLPGHFRRCHSSSSRVVFGKCPGRAPNPRSPHVPGPRLGSPLRDRRASTAKPHRISEPYECGAMSS